MTDETGSLRLFKTFSFLILSSWCLRNYLSEKNKRPTKAFLPLAIAFFSFTDWIFLIHDIIKKSIFSRSALCLQKVVWKPRRKLISDLFFTSFLSYSPPIPPPPKAEVCYCCTEADEETWVLPGMLSCDRSTATVYRSWFWDSHGQSLADAGQGTCLL